MHHANELSILDMLTKSKWTRGTRHHSKNCRVYQDSRAYIMQLMISKDNRVLLFNNPLLSSGLYWDHPGQRCSRCKTDIRIHTAPFIGGWLQEYGYYSDNEDHKAMSHGVENSRAAHETIVDTVRFDSWPLPPPQPTGRRSASGLVQERVSNACPFR